MPRSDPKNQVLRRLEVEGFWPPWFSEGGKENLGLGPGSRQCGLHRELQCRLQPETLIKVLERKGEEPLTLRFHRLSARWGHSDVLRPEGPPHRVAVKEFVPAG